MQKWLGYVKKIINRYPCPILAIALFLFTLSACGGSGGGGSGSNALILAWDKPETNVDGTPLTDLEGYRIYYGLEPDFYYYPEKILERKEVKDNTSQTITFKIEGLSAGTYYFVVVAYDSYGYESEPAYLAPGIPQVYNDRVLCVNISSQGSASYCSK